MDHTSINSLNSKRNLKLPPIQGAVPAAVYGEQNWNTTTKTVSHHRHHTRPRNDLIHASNFQSLNRVDLNSRVEFPRQKAAVFTSPSRQHHVQINLGHEFPKTYTVLPPINHHKKTNVNRPRKPSTKQIDHGKVKLSIEQKKITVNEETKPAPTKTCAETVNQLSARRRERLQEKLKTSENHDTNKDQSVQKLDNTTDENNTNNNTTITNFDHDGRTEDEQDEDDIATRKKSPTFLGHVKCKRFGRRNAVCTENEPSLVNVTDQLKEIFLRRNMEEMYLI